MVKWDGEVYKARYFRSTWVKGKPPIIYAGRYRPEDARHGHALRRRHHVQRHHPAHAAGDVMRNLRAGSPRDGRDAGEFHVNNFCAFHVKEDREASFREARRELMMRGWLGGKWYEPFLTPEESRIVAANKNAFLTAFRTRSGDITGRAAGDLREARGGAEPRRRPERPRPSRRAPAEYLPPPA